MPEKLSKDDLELMEKTRKKHKVDLVLDTIDGDWLREAKRKANPPKEAK